MGGGEDEEAEEKVLCLPRRVTSPARESESDIPAVKFQILSEEFLSPQVQSLTGQVAACRACARRESPILVGWPLSQHPEAPPAVSLPP